MKRFAVVLLAAACADQSATSTGTSTGSGGASAGPRVVVFGADGDVRSLDIDAPFTSRAEASLGAPIAIARASAERIYVVHPKPANRISVLDRDSLSVLGSIELPDANPRDMVVMDAQTAYVTQFDATALAKVDLATLSKSAEVDLAAFADDNGLPEMARATRCDARLFVELQRRERQPNEHPMVAVVDTASGEVQSIELQGPTPDYDMHADCDAGRLFVVEPVPVMIGGGGIEELDVVALASLGFLLTDAAAGGETGGFVVTADRAGWVIFHTEFGSGPSSHLERFPGAPGALWDTFQRVDQLAFDRESDRLFFPDPCTDCVHPPGLVVFDATTGERLTADPVDVGFAPIGVLVAR